jgi:hypothetical protein
MILNQYFLIVPLLLIPTVIQQRKGQSSNHIIIIAHCSPRSIALSLPYTIILYHFIIHLHKANLLESTSTLLRFVLLTSSLHDTVMHTATPSGLRSPQPLGPPPKELGCRPRTRSRRNYVTQDLDQVPHPQDTWGCVTPLRCGLDTPYKLWGPPRNPSRRARVRGFLSGSR